MFDSLTALVARKTVKKKTEKKLSSGWCHVQRKPVAVWTCPKHLITKVTLDLLSEVLSAIAITSPLPKQSSSPSFIELYIQIKPCHHFPEAKPKTLDNRAHQPEIPFSYYLLSCRGRQEGPTVCASLGPLSPAIIITWCRKPDLQLISSWTHWPVHVLC